MSRILLADHSPHAQRMGERILRDEGFEVATVTDGETVLLRLKDLAPDLILADVSLPSRSGYDICEYVKTSGKYPGARVILTAGPITTFDEKRAAAVGSDGFIRKPFEASVLLNTVQPLIEKPENPPARGVDLEVKTRPPAALAPVAPLPRHIEREQVRAAVILAIEASMITIIENITDKVVVALEVEDRTPMTAKNAPPPRTEPRVEVKPQAPEAQPAASTAKAAAASAPDPAPVRVQEPKVQPGPSPDEPVVRIRTPIFRSL